MWMYIPVHTCGICHSCMCTLLCESSLPLLQVEDTCWLSDTWLNCWSRGAGAMSAAEVSEVCSAQFSVMGYMSAIIALTVTLTMCVCVCVCALHYQLSLTYRRTHIHNLNAVLSVQSHTRLYYLPDVMLFPVMAILPWPASTFYWAIKCTVTWSRCIPYRRCFWWYVVYCAKLYSLLLSIHTMSEVHEVLNAVPTLVTPEGMLCTDVSSYLLHSP